MLSEFIQLIETVIHWLPPPGELERFTDLRHSAERLVVRAEQAQDSERDRLLSEADSLYSEAACCRVGKKDLANLWVDRAKLSRAGGLDWVAENDLQRALRFWPRCPEAHLELARLYAARNDTDRAVCYCRNALRNSRTRRDAELLMKDLTRGGRPRAERRLVDAEDARGEEETLEEDP